jgi:hypothetical protein
MTPSSGPFPSAAPNEAETAKPVVPVRHCAKPENGLALVRRRCCNRLDSSGGLERGA